MPLDDDNDACVLFESDICLVCLGLMKLLSDKAGGAITTKVIESYASRIVAFDVSMMMYQFLVYL
jgi:hypothetical protein